MRSLLALWIAICASAPAAQAADPVRGETVFRKCKACHQVGEGAVHKVGPILTNIVGAPIASVAGFNGYSKPLAALSEAGETWTHDSLDAFLTKPRDFAKGTRMTFAGLKKPQDRADVIAYLATFSAPVNATGTGTGASAQGFTVSAEVLALDGDVDYGEYLSTECTTCHQTDGSNDGIPAILGLDTDYFVTAMHAYKQKHRENPVMQVVTGRLSDDEIAALAAFFKSLENEGK